MSKLVQSDFMEQFSEALQMAFYNQLTPQGIEVNPNAQKPTGNYVSLVRYSPMSDTQFQELMLERRKQLAHNFMSDAVDEVLSIEPEYCTSILFHSGGKYLFRAEDGKEVSVPNATVIKLQDTVAIRGTEIAYNISSFLYNIDVVVHYSRGTATVYVTGKTTIEAPDLPKTQVFAEETYPVNNEIGVFQLADYVLSLLQYAIDNPHYYMGIN